MGAKKIKDTAYYSTGEIARLVGKCGETIRREIKKGRLRFHDLRHSRATEFARQDVNPAIACTILGMSLRMYQKVYLNLSGADLLKTIDKIDQGAK